MLNLGYRVAKYLTASPDDGGLGTAFPLPTVNSCSISSGRVGVCSLGLQKTDISQILYTLTYYPHN